MALKTAFRLIAFSAALILSAVSAQAEKRVALVIGNSAYQNTLSLANPVNDAEDIATALKKVGFEVLFERNLTKGGMEGAIARFTRLAQDADAALFFYAGHGMQHRGNNYLMPTDAKLEDEFSLNFELTRLDDVLFGLERARGVKVLVLDACRNNPLLERFTRTTTTRDLAATRGLAKIEATRGMVIAYSTQPNQVAVDGDGRNSPFTTALVKQMDEPGLEIGTLFRRVATDVDRLTNGRQLPELSVSLRGEFYLNTRQTDVQAWGQVRTSNEVAALKDFISHYPSSVLVSDARERLASIEREQAALAQRQAREQAERERVEKDRLVREQAAREKNERERLARERTERENAEREQVVLAEAERKRLTDERAAKEKAQQETAARDEEERKRLVAETTERERTNAGKGETQLALLSTPTEPGPRAAPHIDGASLVKEIKKELKRVGCFSGKVDDKWTTAETKSSVAIFVKYAKVENVSEPTTDFLNDIRGRLGQVCPLECAAGEVQRNGRCVARKLTPNAKTATRTPEGMNAKPALERAPYPHACSAGDKTLCRANCTAGWQRACDFIARHK